ncbi:MAG: type I-U CRISPR-associated protein Cas7 [Rhodoferax ferrireducens]|uniref:Type I-U CRISPR-associated protein Cas7 n=1 Tax=Rhodoferax ferrireducens TaxID=192843 RepID=A0A1W9KQF7_9BURK|nr:MAG: type I-U CRISPR-associated protein Cas7 [Rhodoferax ferrireducens]
MATTNLYTALVAATREASAITLRANLIPANALPDDGKFFVLPPTYAEIGHLASPIREDGTHQYILIESTQSWANRLEELLDRHEVGVGALQVSAAGRVLSVNQLPHRVFDALLRDSELAGEPFRVTPLGKSLTEARADSATALLENAPGTLLFGAWDSFAGAKMGAAKWPAALSGQIMGFEVLQTKKAGIRIDPMNIAKDAVTGFKSESRAEGWTIDEARAVKDAKGKPVPLEKASEIGHGHILATLATKGAWVNSIELRSSLSLTRLRRYHFPVAGRITPTADAAAQTYLAALGLWLMHTRLVAGLELRAGAELDATQAEFVLRTPLQADTALQVTQESTEQALQQALAAAKAVGFSFAAPMTFSASERLEKLIQASESLSQ